MDYVLSCAKGVFAIVRHNEIRDLTAMLLTEVARDVQIEPELQPVTNEGLAGASANFQDGARLDIVANGVWGVGLKRHSLTFVSLIPLQPLSDRPNCWTSTNVTRQRRRGLTTGG